MKKGKKQRVRGAREMLLDALHRRKMSQRAFEEMMGFSGGSVSRWIRGGRTPCRKAALDMQRVLLIPAELW